MFPVPTVSLTANPTSVASGGSSTLTWSSTNATSCASSGAWGVSPKAISGSEPTGALMSSSTFTLDCTGLGGTAGASATVTVTTGTPTYSTNFDLTENPISESGVWHRLSGTVFTDVRTAGGIAFGTNGARDDYDDSYALLSGFGPDQQAEAVVFRSPSLVSGDITHEVELLLRFSDDATTARGYECLFNYKGDLEIVRWNGTMGDFTPLHLTGAGAGSLGRDLMTGDVIKATITGNVIRSYINGALMIEAIDSTYPSGQPGISFFTRPAGVSDNPNFGLKSYTVSSN
jgi:hypothetical protein